MPTREIAGKVVQVNDEGFMTVPTEWDEDIARALAAEEGIAELTEQHWKVIEWIRDRAKGSGWTPPTLRQITTNSGIPTKELFGLFPKTPAKRAAKISGLTKPAGCI